MIAWLGEPARYSPPWFSLGQEQQPQPDPADAAGQAAYQEAQNASWPPTRENAETVGAAAGAAAGTAACAAAGAATAGVTTAAAATGICGIIGSEVGEFVGGIFYDLADSFFGASDATRRNLDRIHRDVTVSLELLKAGHRLCELQGTPNCGTYDQQQLYGCLYNKVIGGNYSCTISPAASAQTASLYQKYHLPSGRGFTWGLEGDDQLQAQLKRIAAAESGRAAEIVARKQIASAPQWQALAKISEFCRRDQACITRTLADLDTVCRQQGHVPDTPEYVNCAVFLAAALPKPVPTAPTSSPVVPLLVGATVIGGLAWLLFA
jgi:hypothetical protein